MITKLTIVNFKGLANWEYALWQDTIITWANGVGKSRIIEAIIYCLTGEVNWYKKKLDCSIQLEWRGISYSRINGMTRGTNTPKNIQRFLCSIVPWYINSLTVKDKIKVMTWIDDTADRLPFEIKGGIKTYDNYRLAVKKVKTHLKVLESYSEEIIDNLEAIKALGNINTMRLSITKARYERIKQHKEATAENVWIQKTIDEVIKRKAKLEERLDWYDFTRDIMAVRLDLETRITTYDLLKSRLENEIRISDKLQEWKCEQCWQDYISEQAAEKQSELVNKIKNDLKGIKILLLRKELILIKKNAEEHEEKLATKRELDWLTEPSFVPVEDLEYTKEEDEDLKVKLDNFEELYSKQEQKKLYEIKNKSLEAKIRELDLQKIQEDIACFAEAEKNYLINKQNYFKYDFDFKLYKENSSTDWGTFTYDITQGDVEYFWLSTGQKLLIDIQISLHLQKTSNENQMPDYLLIDNWERLCAKNLKKAFSLCWNKQIIITKVWPWKLELEID